jgi:hypothetical protein
MKRMRVVLLGLILVLALVSSSWASAGVVVTDLGFLFNDQYYAVPLVPDPVKPGKMDVQPGFYIMTSDFFASISGSLDPDPIIALGFAVTNFGANPANFGFAAAVPIALGPMPTILNASISGGLTDFSGNGVALGLVNQPTVLQNTAGPNSWGAGLAQAFAGQGAGAQYTYGPWVFGPAPGAPVPAGLFTESISFSLTGGNDIAALTSYCSITAVPLPPSAWLLGSGFLGLLGLGWRRKMG